MSGGRRAISAIARFGVSITLGTAALVGANATAWTQSHYLFVILLLFGVIALSITWWIGRLSAAVVAGLVCGIVVGGMVSSARGTEPGGLNLVLVTIFRLFVAVPAVGAGALAGHWFAERLWRSPERMRNLVWLIPALLVVAYAVRIQTDLRRKPDLAIREHLLSDVPLGSSMSAVRDLIRRHGWELRRSDEHRGFMHQGLRPAREVGTKHIEAYLGHYYYLFRNDVIIYWGFDEQGRLIDVWVWKTVDAL